jgi:hypothetical protein
VRTLEVAFLDPRSGGGALRAATVISLRRRVGVEDCRILPVYPQLYDLTSAVVVRALKTCPPAGSASMPGVVQRAPLPGSWRSC